jgi:predicted nucleic acid-binding protein
MAADLFVDTNILVYAHDRDAGRKHKVARDRVRDLWLSERYPAISVQVLQELFVNLRRRDVPPSEARETLRDYAAWRVAETTVALCLQATDEVERWQVSFWDGLILAAARSMGATTLWSEDLNVGQDYGGIHVVNPLAE